MAGGKSAVCVVIVGAAFGSVFACLNITRTASAKMVLVLFMLLGRLELFTVLVLFAPTFWRR